MAVSELDVVEVGGDHLVLRRVFLAEAGEAEAVKDLRVRVHV